jgi:RNA binding exosome subunit
MKERSLRDAIQEFKSGIKKSDFIKVKGNKDYLGVPYRVNFVRGYFGDRLQILTESTELSSGSFKFVSSIILDGKCISNGESKQMHTKEKDFEKSQSVSIGRGLSFAGFMGSEVATAEEMEEFIRTDETFDDKKEIVKATPKLKTDTKQKLTVQEMADQWIEVLKTTAEHSKTLGQFENNLSDLRKEYLEELQTIWEDLIQQQRIEDSYISLQKQINNRKQ